jgi:hypothetical protein
MRAARRTVWSAGPRVAVRRRAYGQMFVPPEQTPVEQVVFSVHALASSQLLPLGSSVLPIQEPPL